MNSKPKVGYIGLGLMGKSMALNIVKTIVPVNRPFSEQAINFGLKKAADAGYDTQILEETINNILDNL